MDYRWFVAQVLSGLEGTALNHLKRDGITAFSPKVSDGTRIFPGYIFVEIADVELEASIVNRTRGVHKLLPMHAKCPLPLPKGFVETLRERIASKDFDEATVSEDLYRFLPKEEVLVKTGPFADHRGRFVRYRKGSGVILAALLGREVELTIPAKELAPIRPRVGRSRGAQTALIAA